MVCHRLVKAVLASGLSGRVVVGEFRFDKAAAGRRTPKSDLGVDSDLHSLKYLKVFFGEFESRAVALGFVVTGMGA